MGAVKGGNGGQQQPPDCSSFLSVLNNQVYTNLIAEKARTEEAVVDKDIGEGTVSINQLAILFY